MVKQFACALAVVALVGSAMARDEKLPKFEADFGAKALGPKTVRIPYTDVTTYYGFVAPGKAPDEVVGGKNLYYLYVWIPAVAPEIGVRMASPGSVYAEIKEQVIKDADYKADNKTDYFDTWIEFQRAADVLSPEDIKTKAGTTSWLKFDSNDDSGDMPANPGGQKYNSLLRITSVPSDPAHALIRGLYRIAFTTYKVGEVKGTFVAQVGAPIKIPGVVIDKTLDGLLKQIEANAAK